MQNLNSEKKDNNGNFIKFGDLKIKLDNKYEHLMDRLPILKSENKIKNYCINDNYITFGTLSFSYSSQYLQNKTIRPVNINESKKDNYFENNKCFQKIDTLEKKKEDLFNHDLYYVFVYIINLIFYNSDVKLIRKELYHCLGDLGIDFYLSQ